MSVQRCLCSGCSGEAAHADLAPRTRWGRKGFRLLLRRIDSTKALVLSLIVISSLAAFLTSERAGAGPAVVCPASRVHYEKPPSGNPQLAKLPWIAPEPRSVGLIGHLFYYSAFPSVSWGKRHVPVLRIYSGGRSPDNRVNMKILWSAPDNLDGRPLLVRGVRVGSADTFSQKLHIGPSILNIPRPGCWRLTLATGNVITRLTAVVERGAATP